jgi:integrase
MPAPRTKPDRDGLYIRGSWWWCRIAGERVSLRLKATEPRAAAARAAQRARELAGDPAYAAATLKSVSAACAEWLAYIPTADNRKAPPSAATCEMYALHLGHFARLLGGAEPVASITAEAVDRYIAARRSEPGTHGRNVHPSTVDKELGTLRQVLRLGLRRGWYHLPLERVIPPAGDHYTPLTRHLTIPQVWQLLEQLEWRRAAVVAYVVATGADWCAVGRAEAGDLGGPEACALLCLVRGSKNSARWDEVPIVAPFGELAAVARGWLVAHGSFEPWSHEKCREVLERACRRAGLPRVTARDLRRSHGKALAAAGVPAGLIGRQLRHTDSRMAERVYAVPERADVRWQVAAAQRFRQ